MEVKRYCSTCEQETLFDVVEREGFSDIEDGDLDSSDLIAKMNGDIVTTYTCQECFTQEEEL